MPATPAWPPKSLPRLFVRTALSPGATVALDAGQANYLGNVMRLGPGEHVLLFDGVSGEWIARIAESGRKRMPLSPAPRPLTPTLSPPGRGHWRTAPLARHPKPAKVAPCGSSTRCSAG